MQRSLVAACALSCSLFLTGCGRERQNETEARRQAEIEEFNAMTEVCLMSEKQVREQAELYGDKLMGLYLFNRADDSLQAVFREINNEENIVSSESFDTVETKSFLSYIRDGVPVDTYDNYLRDFARKRGIAVSDIEQNVQAWLSKTDSERGELLGTAEDCSFFALAEAAVVHHGFYTRLGTDVITEIYCFAGKNSEKLSVVVLWQNGQIIDVTRLYAIL